MVPDEDLRLVGRGRILVGGTPLRILRLSPAGARVVRELFRGRPVGEEAGRASLARRLVAVGMAHPVPPAETAPAGAGPDAALPPVVVVPVRDDPTGLARTLRALSGGSDESADHPGTAPRCEVIVVDDGSVDPAGLATVVAGRGRIIRRTTSGGPGAARMTGVAATDAPVVAFVDAGVEVAPGGLARLAAHLADPAVAAVAPRVASTPGPGRIARYERAHSPLDLGDRPANVRPGSWVPYVPTACVVVRAGALASVGGFDPDLRHGEDVDLVWRLVETGLDVRYDPSVVASHPSRPSLSAWVRQRLAYGASAGPLARRHGPKVSPSRCSAWSVAVWALAVGGHPLAGAALAAWTARALRPKLAAVPEPGMEALRLAVTGHWWAGRNLSHHVVRSWWPVTVVATRWPVGRRLALFGVTASAALRWRTPNLPRTQAIALGLADDVAYGAGVWWGLRRGGAAAVLPELVAWPGRQDVADAALTGR